MYVTGLDGARLVGPSDVDRFLTDLLSEERPPMVVASIREGSDRPSFDLEALFKELGDAFEYVVLEPEATFRLSDALTKQYSVHSGWLRVYPSNRRWRDEPTLARNYPPDLRSPRRALDRIVGQALDLLYREGTPPAAREPASTGVRASVVVEGILSATHVAVRSVTSKDMAVMSTTKLLPGIAAERLVRKGQRFDGTLLRSAILGSFVPDPSPGDPVGRALERIGPGITTLALVDRVRRSRADVTIVPGFDLVLEADDGQDLREDLATGDIVVVDVIDVDGVTVVSLSDDEPEPALPVLPDGPPWLVIDAGLDEPAPDSPDDTPDVGDGPVVDIAGDDLHAELQAKTDRIEQLERQLRDARREGKRQARRAVPRAFADPERQFRFEVEMAWLTSVPEADREAGASLQPYVLGPNFLASVDSLVKDGGITREKIVNVAMEVACGTAWTKPSRGVKEWRESARGHQLTRPDGSGAWRVRLQVGSHAARRLKFWRLPDGTVEFDVVCVHDDGIIT